MKEDIEKTRAKVGIDKLDEKQRKRLFKEFIEHGGETISKRGRTRGKIDRSYATDKEASRQEEKELAKKRKYSYTVPKKITYKSPSGSKNKFKLTDRIILYYKGNHLKILSPAGKKLRNSFITFLNKHIRECLIDLDVTLGSFLKGSNSIRREILKASKGRNDNFYEFVYRLSHLYKENEFDTIARILTNKKIPQKESLFLFKQFFKKFYIIGPFPDLCVLYSEKALMMWVTKNRIGIDLAEKIKIQIKKDIEFILNTFYYQFHIILCYIGRTYYPLYSQRLDDFLEITEKDKIGYITRLEKKRRIEGLKKQREYFKKMKGKSDQSEYREEAVIPRHVQRGLTLIDELYPLFEKTIVENDKRLTFIEKNDKLYRATILLEIFEAEYSFLLTTSKITFTIDYREQKKIDVKEDCNGAYMLFSEALEEISDYLDIIKEIHETEKNLRLTSYQKTGILETLSKKRSLLSKETRYKISDAMKAIETILTLVITDYNDTKRLLQNPDDIFTFDINIDGKKHLEGKKVIDAIVETFLFASTLAFQTTFGTLSGSGIYIEKTDAAT